MFRQAYATYGSGRYVGLTIGNETNDSSGNIMGKVYDVRGMRFQASISSAYLSSPIIPPGYLRSVGVNTPVSTVHTWVRVRDDPALCGADFVGANAQ